MGTRRIRPSLPASPRTVAFGTLEVLAAVSIATGAVAALQSTTNPAGLGALYLLAVLEVAIRRGQVAALATALLSVLTLNFFFIAPRYRLAIAHSPDVVELIVFLIAAVVVGRLAATSRWRAAQAESRTQLASAREREATLLADVASAILAGDKLSAQLQIWRSSASAWQSRLRKTRRPVEPRAPERRSCTRSRTTCARL